jgi:DNA-binding NarL/FixJ family response regulator
MLDDYTIAGFDWSYGEVTSTYLASRKYLAAAVPVLHPAQAGRLASLARENPLIALIGVVTDPSGVLTHQAIQSGASCVINTLVPAECSRAAVEALLTPRAENAGSVAIGPATWFAAREDDPLTEAGPADQDALLIRLVCAGATTVELSERFYCSERSMYRRLRELYDRLDVANRRELRRAMNRAMPGHRRRPTAQQC